MLFTFFWSSQFYRRYCDTHNKSPRMYFWINRFVQLSGNITFLAPFSVWLVIFIGETLQYEYESWWNQRLSNLRSCMWLKEVNSYTYTFLSLFKSINLHLQMDGRRKFILIKLLREYKSYATIWIWTLWIP